METKRTSAKLFLVMVATVYLLAYAVRWAYLSYYMTTSTVLTDVSPDWNVIIPGALDQSLMISTVIFGAFFLVSVPAGLNSGQPVLRTSYRAPRDKETVILLALILATIFFRRLFGSTLGQAPSDIPLGLGTPIYRAHSDLFPGLLLLCAEAALLAGVRRRYLFWLCALAAFNLALALVTTSKAGLIYFAVQLLMLMYLTGQNILKRPWRLAALAVAGIIVFIVAAQLRSQALLGVDAQIMVALKEGRVVETFLEVAGLIANRLPGAEGLALYCGTTCTGLQHFSMPSFSGAAGTIFTQQVVGVRADYDYRSPGLIGGAVIIAGLWGGGALVVGFLRATLGILRAGDRRGMSAAARALVCFGVFRFILEGVWAWQDLASLTISAVIVEVASRRWLTADSSHRDDSGGQADRLDTHRPGLLAGER